MNQCKQEGFYRISITEYGLKEAESGALAVSIRAKLIQCWQNEEWVNWDHYDQEADGDVWVVKKDGTPNEGAIHSLAQWAGWDGDMQSLVNANWQPLKCQCQVKREDYKGETRFKIAFLNDWNPMSPAPAGRDDTDIPF